MIYADNAATTKLDIDAFEAMKPFLLEEYGNASQPYSFARAAKKALKSARSSIAECIGALPEEIYFTSGGTESVNWAIKSVAIQNRFCGTIVTSSIEHHAVLNSCAAMKDLGSAVRYLPASSDGTILPNSLRFNMTNDTFLVSIMFANNEIGSIQPISLLAETAHQRDALFHTDAVQAIGHVEVDVKRLGVDFLSASAHKFNGPKGAGFLYIRDTIKIPPYADGGAQEFGMRAGTENIAAVVGMAFALKKNCEQLEQNMAKTMRLEEALLASLNEKRISYSKNGAKDHIPGNISLSFENISGESILHRLDLMGICISTGSACDGDSTKVSHVLRAIGLDEDVAKGTIRISINHDNSINDIKAISTCLEKIYNERR